CVNEIVGGAEAADEPRYIRFADHHPAEQHEFRYRWPDAPEVSAKQPPVERFRHDGASRNSGARHIAAIVRMGATREKFHIGSLAQIIDDGGAALKIGILDFTIAALADQRVEIPIGLLGAVAKARIPALAITWNPERAG